MQAIAWLHCLVAVCRNTVVLVNNEGNTDVLPLAAMLLDRRLIKAKGPRITSFIGGSVLAFLSATALFPDSTVLDAVPPDTLEAFTSLICHALGPAQRRFKLLFRSSRDGASAAAFHSRCDAQGPTLTLIKDMDGNVFGGYTAVHWSSPAADDNLLSYGWYFHDHAAFLYTVVNPHADPPALFPLTVGAYARAIVCDSFEGPIFGEALRVGGAFDGSCCSYIGDNYANTTRHSGWTVLTGARNFRPAEVEVWGLAND